MSKIEDLEALGRMLDEGRVDREEYDRLKADLLAEEEPASAHLMACKPAGWYSDPTGTHSHQAYWDGHRWSGTTRPLPPTRRPTRADTDEVDRTTAVPPARPTLTTNTSSKRKTGLWVVLAVVILIVLAAQGGSTGSVGPATRPPPGTGIYDDLPLQYGEIIPGETDCATLQGIFDAADNAHDGRIDVGDVDGARAFTRTMAAADHRMEEVGCYG